MGTPIAGAPSPARPQVAAHDASRADVMGATTPITTVGRQADDSVLVSTGQTLTPVGQQVQLSERPNAGAVSPDSKTAAFLSAPGNTPGATSIVVVDLATGTVKQQFTSGDDGNDSFNGILYSRDGTHLYASYSDGKILIANVAADGTLSTGALVALPVDPAHAYNGIYTAADPGGLALSPDGATLYIALSRYNALGVFDLSSQKLVDTIPVGNAPWGVIVDGTTAYVSNQGGRVAATGDFTNTSSGTSIVADPITGGSATGTVSVVNLTTRTTTQTITVGLQPTALYLDHAKNDLFVANTNGDSVSVVDTTTKQVVKTINVQPYPNAPFGSSPNGLAVLPDGRLAVSLGMNNALAVYTYAGPTQAVSFDGLLPTGQYPGSLGLDTARGRLVVANVKGIGALGPPLKIGPEQSANKTGRNVFAYSGSVSLIPYPSAGDLATGTTRVARNNGWDRLDTTPGNPSAAPRAIPLHVGDPSTIKHVFYVIKENRTYDQILGDDVRGNGDPGMVEFGRDVTPNEHALAVQFPLLDNFYENGTLSATGHQWTDQAFSPDYNTKAFDAFGRSYTSIAGDSLAYLPSGFIWDDAVRHGLPVHVFGEDANVGYYSNNGTHTDIPGLEKILDHTYPPFVDLYPSDQSRASLFARDLGQYVTDKNLPSLVIIQLPNDHTAGLAPGYPTPRALVADNDLALGRIVDAISHSPYWPTSAVFAVEDDSQDGVDHVDGHRSTAFIASPYARRGVVDHTFHDQVDLVRTIEQILGLPPMNQMDQAASPMTDAFTDTADLAPYNAVSNTVPLTEYNPNPDATNTAIAGATQTAAAGAGTVTAATATPTAAGTTTPYTPTSSIYSSAVLADHPVAYYPLDETSGNVAHDATGDGYNGTINGGVTLGVPGAITSTVGDTAMRLDGHTGYISLGDPAALQPAKLSIELWLKTTANTQGNAEVLRKRYYGYEITLQGGVVSFDVADANNQGATVSSSRPLDDGQYHHIVATYDGSAVALYVDGQLNQSLPTGGIYYLPDAIAIGRDGGHSGSYLDGTVDDVSIYNYALTPAQVTKHFQAAQAGATGGAAGGGGPTATPELGSGDLLGGGVIVAALLYWRQRRRRGKRRADAALGASTLVALLLFTGALPVGRPTIAHHAVLSPLRSAAADAAPASAAMRALQAAWADASTRMLTHNGQVRFVPDGQNARLFDRAIWYSAKGWTTPYPGDKRVLWPQEVLAQDHYLWQLRPDLGTRRLGGSQAHR